MRNIGITRNASVSRTAMLGAIALAIVVAALSLARIVRADSAASRIGAVVTSNGIAPRSDALARATSSAKHTVVLDPGHGGDEAGATGNGIVERDSNLDMALRVRALLLAAGVNVVLTRSTDGRADGLDTTGMDDQTATFVDLQARVAAENAAHADLFLSLHSNDVDSPENSGLEVYYNDDRPFAADSEAFATLLAQNVVARLVTTGYAAPETTVRNDTSYTDVDGHTTPFFVLGPSREVTADEIDARGLDTAALGVARGESYETGATDAPGALIELLYVSNPDDAALLRDDVARDAMAKGVAQAILEYLDGV